MIGKDVVKKVAEVARLKLTSRELDMFSRDLKSILKAFDDIKKADTKHVKPTFQPIEVSNVLRDDKPEACLPQDEALANTSHKEEGHFKGPKVV
jgi:aspartyl-tRNA(Asn)/glutamyl-tRNA(Gln) amidotransferase subunit C